MNIENEIYIYIYIILNIILYQKRIIKKININGIANKS